MVKSSMMAVFWLAGTICALPQSLGANASADSTRTQVAGTWRGNSVCMVENSPCRNEVNVYRFAAIAGKPGWFLVTGSKVIDGKEIVMGTGEWKYDQEKQVLQSEGPHGTFRLTVLGDKMEGSLTDKDGVVYRRIYLKKEK